jgi:hypothetical protein
MTPYEQYQKFIKTLYAPTDVICFAGILPHGDSSGKPKVIHDFVDAAWAMSEGYFNWLSKANEAYSIYVGMNSYKPELKGQRIGRTKANVAEVKRLFIDVDDNGEAVLQQIQNDCGITVPPPNVVLNSSPRKFQFIWNVSGLDQDTAEPLLRDLASKYNADPAVAEVARVLSVPGFVNRKYSDLPVVGVVGEMSPAVFVPIDFNIEKVGTATNVPPGFHGVDDNPAEVIPRDSNGLVPEGFRHKAIMRELGHMHNEGFTLDYQKRFDKIYEWTNANCAPAPDAHRRQHLKACIEYSLKMKPPVTLALTMKPDQWAIQKYEQETAVAQQTPMAQQLDVSNWRNEFRSVGEMDDGPIIMVITGVLQEGTCFIGASPGDAKTLMALSWAKAISTGQPLFGLPQYSVPVARQVIYLIPETGDRPFKKRLKAFRIPDGDNFLVRTISMGVPLALSSPLLLEACRQTKPVVFLDTASRFMTSNDENSAAQNRMLVNDVIALLSAGAVSVVLLHHATKAAKNEVMTLDNMLRGSSDLGAMCDQTYGLRKDARLYANGNGPLEVDLVALKDREDIGQLTSIRLAAKCLKPGDDFPRSIIDETGDFRVVSDSETHHRTVDTLLAIIRKDACIPVKDLAKDTSLSEHAVSRMLSGAGWHRVQGGKGGASPWHQDLAGPCPYDERARKATEKDAKLLHPPKAPKTTLRDAVTFLERELAGTEPDGEYIDGVPEVDVLLHAEAASIKETLTRRAAKSMGILVDPKTSEWRLPGNLQDVSGEPANGESNSETGETMS